MFISLLLAISMQHASPHFGHPWDHGSIILSQHPDEFDVSIAEFQYRTVIEQRSSTGANSSDGPRPISIVLDRFKTTDSTLHGSGDTLDVVTPKMPNNPGFEFKPGQKYFLITCPQQNGKVVDLDVKPDFAEQRQGAGEFYKTYVTLSLESRNPNEEMCKTALMTSAPGLKRTGEPASTIALSAFDCLQAGEPGNFIDTFEFLCGIHDPDPAVGNNGPIYNSDNPASLALRQYAAQPSTTLTMRIAAFQILNAWHMRDTVKPIIHGYEEAAQVEEACPQGPGIIRIPVEEERYRPKTEAILHALNHAVNKPMIRYFLRELMRVTRDQDQTLAKWLNSPDQGVRYETARHFSRSRARPDLMPADGSFVGEAFVYPDLDEKVSAWKTYFGIN